MDALFAADSCFLPRFKAVSMPRQQEKRWKQSKQRSKGTIAVIVLAMVSRRNQKCPDLGGRAGTTTARTTPQISTLIHEKGITHLRNRKTSLPDQSTRAELQGCGSFLNNTGAGITNESSLQQAIEKRCPHYSILKDVLGDRPSTRPLVTSDDLALLDGAELELDFHEECNDQPAESTLSQEGGAKKRKLSNGAARRSSSIRARSPSVSTRYLTGLTSTQRCHAQRRCSKKASAKCMTRISC
ncbi:hypothetical protein GQ600_1144 [Phytophthora cactorum]|nr:hypothetical protein GQ600_1144 [Phytophthora cactorum]